MEKLSDNGIVDENCYSECFPESLVEVGALFQGESVMAVAEEGWWRLSQAP